MSKTVGILGGMGPLATCDLFYKIVKNTNAQTDQDHLHIIINNNPKIPARIDTLIKDNETPLSELIKSAKILEQSGADFIVMPCNTAHIWLDQIAETITIPCYDMIKNTVKQTLSLINERDQKIFLLATNTAIKMNLYQNAFKNTIVELILPTEKEQMLINKAINEVKAGNIENNSCMEELNQMLETYETMSVSTLLGGCTEIPLLFPYIKTNMLKLDPALMLAKLVIDIST
ncbi:cysteate racemase [Metabacillus arenae]|uniref:Amino acid racemase n=1 Tax=Metabacillus arenae TaxID=2771434 RepID=A0A926NF64_9BACI|nr:amino acid racemase [Metabacillus arenae]MBD1383137.1 amino acid racemase [Metabacillus arenae]